MITIDKERPSAVVIELPEDHPMALDECVVISGPDPSEADLRALEEPQSVKDHFQSVKALMSEPSLSQHAHIVFRKRKPVQQKL